MKKITLLLVVALVALSGFMPAPAKAVIDQSVCQNYTDTDAQFSLCRGKFINHLDTKSKVTFRYLTDLRGETTAAVIVKINNISHFVNLKLNQPQEFDNGRGLALRVNLYQLNEKTEQIIVNLETVKVSTSYNYVKNGLNYLSSSRVSRHLETGISFKLVLFDDTSLRLSVDNSDKEIVNIVQGTSKKITDRNGRVIRITYVNRDEWGPFVQIDTLN